MALRVIILAAGKGTRMNSELPKVVHSILNKAMINYVLDTATAFKPQRTYIVVGYKRELVENVVSNTNSKIEYIYQKQQRGTGHAIKVCKKALGSYKGNVLILNGDCPGVSVTTLRKLINKHNDSKSVISFISSSLDKPIG